MTNVQLKRADLANLTNIGNVRPRDRQSIDYPDIPPYGRTKRVVLSNKLTLTNIQTLSDASDLT